MPNDELRDQVIACRNRFIEIADRRGYRQAVRQIRREFPADVCSDFETQRRTKIVGSEHGDSRPDPEAVAAGKRYRHLHDRTCKA